MGCSYQVSKKLGNKKVIAIATKKGNRVRMKRKMWTFKGDNNKVKFLKFNPGIILPVLVVQRLLNIYLKKITVYIIY